MVHIIHQYNYMKLQLQQARVATSINDVVQETGRHNILPLHHLPTHRDDGEVDIWQIPR